MKVFIIPKKKVWITSITIFIIVMLCFSYWIIVKSPKTFAVELSYNSVISDEFKEKITNLIFGDEKIAYLTFDDGPNISVTPQILDILKSEEVKATFL